MTDHGWGINLSAHSPSRARAAAAQPGAPRVQPPPWGPPAETLLSSGGAVSAQTPRKRAGGVRGNRTPRLRALDGIRCRGTSSPPDPSPRLPLCSESAAHRRSRAVKSNLRTLDSGITRSSVLEGSGLHPYSQEPEPVLCPLCPLSLLPPAWLCLQMVQAPAWCCPEAPITPRANLTHSRCPHRRQWLTEATPQDSPSPKVMYLTQNLLQVD